MSKDLYICPVCKVKNEETQKYCTGCGTWLLSEKFPAKKHQVDNNIDRLYVCAFCDTANEPNRNACKKCFKPLFSTEYETKEIQTRTKGNRKWLKVIYLATGIPFALLSLLVMIFDPVAKIRSIGALTLLFGVLGIGITVITALVLLISSKFGANKNNWLSLLLTTIVFLTIGSIIMAKMSPPTASLPVAIASKVESTTTPEPPKAVPVEKTKKAITKKDFDQLQSGMTYEKVTEILGMLGEVQSEFGFKGEKSHTISYQYKGEGSPGANAALTFQENKLTNKIQIGLK